MRDSFRQTILAHRTDDGPRLVYADWLEEQGCSDLAEFIRVQIELAKPSQCPTCGGRRWYEISDCESDACIACSGGLDSREQTLWARHGVTWFNETGLVFNNATINATIKTQQIYAAFTIHRVPSGGIWLRWRRGFLGEVRIRWEDWVGAFCPHCSGLGRDPGPPTGWCKSCGGTGRLPRYDAMLCQQPITLVHLTTNPYLQWDDRDWKQCRLVGRDRNSQLFPMRPVPKSYFETNTSNLEYVFCRDTTKFLLAQEYPGITFELEPDRRLHVDSHQGGASAAYVHRGGYS